MKEDQGLQGRSHDDIPTKAKLTQGKFGQPDKSHSFAVEPIFEHVLLDGLPTNFRMD